ncbi:hypothetical protein ACFO4L_14625 [Bacillus daqingensis]|uniref:Uncharacterized protein n=2 Tax=Bacillaceae TaxID=186817 RepID=A0A969PNE1_9BACI|nr:hypothetical protein [Alkalicoccus luteus]NJP37407.1 hypothetical protein [Alkalicoccus luteus]
MKKKLMVTALASMFSVGALAACGDMEGNEIENEPMENNGMENDGMEDNDADM